MITLGSATALPCRSCQRSLGCSTGILSPYLACCQPGACGTGLLSVISLSGRDFQHREVSRWNWDGVVFLWTKHQAPVPESYLFPTITIRRCRSRTECISKTLRRFAFIRALAAKVYHQSALIHLYATAGSFDPLGC